MIRTAAFIQQLAEALNTRIAGYTVALCFSQNKDELVIGLAGPSEDFYILADLVPQVSLLAFPKEYHRARKNTVNIFEPVIGLKVKGAVAHSLERSFHLELENDFRLMFKMHGRNANIILFEGEKAILIFKNNLENDWNIDLSHLIKVDDHPCFPSETTDPIGYSNRYYEDFQNEFYIKQEKENILKPLEARIKKSRNYIEITRQKQLDVGNKSDYSKIANILMANLHLKIENQPSATFFDFYDNKEIEIKLKKDFSLQKNAEIYYRKSKNQRIEAELIQKNISDKERELHILEIHRDNISKIDNVKTLRAYAKDQKLIVVASEIKKELPFKSYEINGFQILVGKNAANNDLLTFKYSFKEDLWLHAKDVSGSHVIIKYRSGQNFPKNTIEAAAQLAAYYSKRKTDSLVPVTVTHKKYVRKPKGLPPGKVIVEREDIVLVEPKDI